MLSSGVSIRYDNVIIKKKKFITKFLLKYTFKVVLQYWLIAVILLKTVFYLQLNFVLKKDQKTCLEKYGKFLKIFG